MGASVWLNQVGQSVGVSLDDPTMAQTVTFDYTVTVDPSTAVNGTNATGTVTLFVTEDTLGGVGEGCSIDPQVTSSRSLMKCNLWIDKFKITFWSLSIVIVQINWLID